MGKQRYEKEIEEILRKYDDEQVAKGRKPRTERPVPDPRFGRTVEAPRRRSGYTSLNWRRMSAGQYMVAAFAVALIALFMHSLFPLLASILVLVSVALFLVPIVLYRVTGASGGGWSPREEKRWRGEVIDFNSRARRSQPNDPLEMVKRWFRRR